MTRGVGGSRKASELHSPANLGFKDSPSPPKCDLAGEGRGYLTAPGFSSLFWKVALTVHTHRVARKGGGRTHNWVNRDLGPHSELRGAKP